MHTIDKACSQEITLSQSFNEAHYSLQSCEFIAMPPVRRVRIRDANEGSASSNNVSNVRNNVVTITSLRRQWAEKGLPTHGRRNALVARLQHHATANENLRVTTTEEPQPPPTDLLTLSTESKQLLSEAQLAQMQSIASRCVEQAAAEIASKAVWAAVQAMSNSTSCASGSNAANNIPVVLDDSEVRLVNESNIPTLTASQSTNATQRLPYGNGFHEVPAAYVKQIQSGEFFDLAKLLPKNMSTGNQPDEPIILTLENSVIKAKMASQPTARITDIEQCTTAYTLYMSVMTHQFPGRA